MSPAVALPTNPSALTVGRVTELVLDSLANAYTIRGHATAVGKTAEMLGEHRPPAAVVGDEVGEVPKSLWGRTPAGTRNARREVTLREKKLYRMLYETAGRAEEILGLNIEDLDQAGL